MGGVPIGDLEPEKPPALRAGGFAAGSSAADHPNHLCQNPHHQTSTSTSSSTIKKSIKSDCPRESRNLPNHLQDLQNRLFREHSHRSNTSKPFISEHPQTLPNTPNTSFMSFFDIPNIDPRSKNPSNPNIPEMVWRPPDHQNSIFLTSKSPIQHLKTLQIRTSPKWSGGLQTIKTRFF